MTLQTIAQLNTVPIYSCEDQKFSKYGRILKGYDTTELSTLVDMNTDVKADSNTYVPRVSEFEHEPFVSSIRDNVFGGIPIQVGYCNGPNSFLNGLEYHKSSEVLIAITDCVLILGLLSDVEGYRTYNTEHVECFFIPKNTALEIFANTLHFSPCKTNPDGFKTIIILPHGTNTPLVSNTTNEHDPETRLLFMKNKWLLAHPERIPLIEKGAHPGLIGKNIEIKNLAYPLC